MRRVLFIDSAPFVGGAQESFASLVGCFPDCAVAVGGGLSSRFPNAACIHVNHWPASCYGLLQFLLDRHAASKTLQRLIADYAPEIIHANTLRTALLLTSTHLPCPLVIHDRDIKAPRIVVRYAASRLEPTVIAISSSVAAKWHGLVPDSRINIVHNGFILDEIRSTAPTSLPWDGRTVAIVADMEPWKRHSLFIKAFALAVQKLPNLHAVVRGRARTTEGKAYLESLRNEARDIPNLEFNISSGPALPLIAASDLIVTCSQNEPFGRTIIEALALAKPVVATPTAAPPELFDALAPNLVRTEDSPEALADSILEALGKAPPPIPLTGFSIETMKEYITSIYNSL